MLALSFVEELLMCFILMSIVGLSKGSEDGVVILTRGAEKPPTDSVTVVEGGTLILHCEVPTEMLREVWWGKGRESSDVYLTEQDGVTSTTDSRVSSSRSVNFTLGNNDYRTYTIRISPAKVTDESYFCLAKWTLSANVQADLYGEFSVYVTDFQNGNPNCWSTRDSIDGILVWCETEHAYPGVNITWTVRETGEVVSVTSANVRIDASGRTLVWSSYQVSREQQTRVLVCTVKSPEFPGQSQTCSVAPPPVGTVSTSINPYATNTQTESTNESSGTTPSSAADVTTTTLLRPDTTQVSSDYSGLSTTLPNDYATTIGPLTSTTVRAIPDSSPDIVTVSTAVAIPSFTLLLVALLLCILKRRRRRPGANGRGKNSGTTTEGLRSNCDAGPCGVVAAPVTRMPHHGSGRTTAAGGDAFDSPYEEVELDHPIARSVKSAEAPDKDGLGQNTCVIYQTVHPADDSDSDTSSCESDSLHQERVNSYNDKIVAGGDSDKFEASTARSDESDGKMVDNPIYQSYDDEYPSH